MFFEGLTVVVVIFLDDGLTSLYSYMLILKSSSKYLLICAVGGSFSRVYNGLFWKGWLDLATRPKRLEKRPFLLKLWRDKESTLSVDNNLLYTKQDDTVDELVVKPNINIKTIVANTKKMFQASVQFGFQKIEDSWHFLWDNDRPYVMKNGLFAIQNNANASG